MRSPFKVLCCWFVGHRWKCTRYMRVPPSHPNYTSSNPLEFKWICPRCRKERWTWMPP